MHPGTCSHRPVLSACVPLGRPVLALLQPPQGSILTGEGAQPAPWKHHSLPLPLCSPPHLRRATVFANGSLLLTQVRPRNAGVYRCVGQGQRGPPVILEATLHLAGGSLVLGWGAGIWGGRMLGRKQGEFAE